MNSAGWGFPCSERAPDRSLFWQGLLTVAVGDCSVVPPQAPSPTEVLSSEWKSVGNFAGLSYNVVAMHEEPNTSHRWGRYSVRRHFDGEVS